jgi:hypothetical protein
VGGAANQNLANLVNGQVIALPEGGTVRVVDGLRGGTTLTLDGVPGATINVVNIADAAGTGHANGAGSMAAAGAGAEQPIIKLAALTP